MSDNNLRRAGFALMVGRYRLTLPVNDPNAIAIERDGEGGHFSLLDFEDAIEQFFNERF